jgi:hypothetical protein
MPCPYIDTNSGFYFFSLWERIEVRATGRSMTLTLALSQRERAYWRGT